MEPATARSSAGSSFYFKSPVDHGEGLGFVKVAKLPPLATDQSYRKLKDVQAAALGQKLDSLAMVPLQLASRRFDQPPRNRLDLVVAHDRERLGVEAHRPAPWKRARMASAASSWPKMVARTGPGTLRSLPSNSSICSFVTPAAGGGEGASIGRCAMMLTFSASVRPRSLAFSISQRHQCSQSVSTPPAKNFTASAWFSEPGRKPAWTVRGGGAPVAGEGALRASMRSAARQR